MRKKSRITFAVHVIVATFCVACGLLDAYGHSNSWLIPSIAVLYFLMASAVMLPILAAVSVIGSGYKHPVRLIAIHIAMGATQLLFGLLPLIG
jgi:hypothetical protein